VPLLFPTGRPPTKRWWIVGVFAVTSILLATTALAIRPGPVDEDVPSAGTNPLGIPGAGGVADTLELAGLLSFFIAALGSFASVAVRTRRSQGEEQRQLRIFLAGIAVVFAVLVVPESHSASGARPHRSPSPSSASSRCRSRSHSRF
jgi:hypothetical protein